MFSTHHIAFLQWPLGHVCPGIASTYFRREASGALERAWTLPLRWRVIATMKRIVEWTNPDQSSASALMHLFWSFVNSRWISLIRRQLIKQAQDFWACEFQNGYSYCWWTAHLHHVQLQVNARQTAVADEPGAQNPSILSSHSHFWIVWKYGSTVPQFPIIIYHDFPFCRRPGTTLRSTERSSADWKHLTGVFLGISSKHLTFSQYQPRRL